MPATCPTCDGAARIHSTQRGFTVSIDCPRCRGPKHFKANGTITIRMADGYRASVCVAAGDTVASATALIIKALEAMKKGTP